MACESDSWAAVRVRPGRGGPSSARQGCADLAELSDGQRVVRADHLHSDMVGAGQVMLADARRPRGRFAPGDRGIYQPVAAASGEVLLGEAQPQEVAAVVDQAQGGAEVLPADLARPGRV